MEKKLDGNYTRMLPGILHKSRRQHPTKQQLYGPLPPITKTFKIRQTRHAGHCWRSRDELINDLFLWTPSHRQTKAGCPGWTCIQQLCADMGCSFEDLPEAMDNREVWREKVRNIHADSVTWWWWWLSSLGQVKIFAIFWYKLVYNLYITWLKQFKLSRVLTVVSSMVGVLTCCAWLHSMFDLKVTKINMQCCLIQKLILYKFKQDY